MPPEWGRHERTWMEFPPGNTTFGSDPQGELGQYRKVWAAVTNAIARFEPVSLICDIGDGAAARALVDPSVIIHETLIDECWFRDSGPTFVTHPDGRIGAVLWRFNGWGQQEFADWDDEQHVGALAATLAGAEHFTSSMVNEGGGIHVDGEGTVMITRTVQLDPFRNPDWTAEQVEAELEGFPRRREGDLATARADQGLQAVRHARPCRHCCRVGTPGLVVAHSQPDSSHPDFEVCNENLAILRASTDARGRQLEVVEIEAPTVTHADGDIVDWSYINHYVCNGAVILCSFSDPRDEAPRQR